MNATSGSRAIRSALRSAFRAAIALAVASASTIASIATAQATPAVAVHSRQPSDTSATVSVAGTVYDSVAATPLSGAEVQFVDSEYRARAYAAHTDSLGHFRMTDVRPGAYIVGFFHSALDALGISPPLRVVTVRAGAENVVTLAIPGGGRIMPIVCGVRPSSDSVGAMAGIVSHADTGIPIAGAKVVVTWTEIVIDKRGLVTEHRRVPAQTAEDGSYRICGLPGADTVIASVESNSAKSGVIEVPIVLGGIVRRDFTLGDSATAVSFLADSSVSAEVRSKTTVLRGSARLNGLVRGADGKLVAGAKILVWGTGLETTSRSDGTFTLTGLPSGTFSVEARLLGFEPERKAVDLASAVPAVVDFTFSDRVRQLSRVVVVGKASRGDRDIDDFVRRSRNGMGHYITAADPLLANAMEVTDALRMTPGVRVAPSGSFGHAILLRGGCVPAVYVDGTEMVDGYTTLDDVVPPQDVAGIEVYTGLGEAPPQYLSNGCGVILVWSKR